MNYYLDTEFLEGTQSKSFLGIQYGKTKPTIDLISIGIVSGDGREYYAISKEFNLKEAWNRFQQKIVGKKDIGMTPIYEKEYWLRDNVLLPIWKELQDMYCSDNMTPDEHYSFTYQSLKELLKMYGKTNSEIAKEMQEFVFMTTHNHNLVTEPTFYGYYADYDWVVFCWLFGTMIHLPKGFPMYCRDLKQMADEIWEKTGRNTKFASPKNEHNALVDAKWNKLFHEFLFKVQHPQDTNEVSN